jgi:hypothetical protein
MGAPRQASSISVQGVQFDPVGARRAAGAKGRGRTCDGAGQGQILAVAGISQFLVSYFGCMMREKTKDQRPKPIFGVDMHDARLLCSLSPSCHTRVAGFGSRDLVGKAQPEDAAVKRRSAE